MSHPRPLAPWRRLLWALLLAVALTAGRIVDAQTAGVETGPLDALRREALSLVNASRRDQGLEPLGPAAALDAAAQAHAEDMLKRGFYSHVSPEGGDPQDRYIEHGGARGRTVAENIATCEGCTGPPTADWVRRFHEGWMQSPDHRHNILATGLDAFGFGIAAGNKRFYAVQTFAGAGASPGPAEAGAAAPLSPEAQATKALAAFNRARGQAGLAPLQASDALTAAARRAVGGGSGAPPIDTASDPFDFLPGGRDDWRVLSVVTAECGGCGAAPGAADIGHFTEQWLGNSQSRETVLSANATYLGFALVADGKGRKAAAAFIGERR